MTTYQQQIIDTIGKGEPFITTPRDLFRSFGFERRTKLNRDAVDQFLEENELNVVPHYSSVWVDENITILQKEKATRRSLACIIHSHCALSSQSLSDCLGISRRHTDFLSKAARCA